MSAATSLETQATRPPLQLFPDKRVSESRTTRAAEAGALPESGQWNRCEPRGRRQPCRLLSAVTTQEGNRFQFTRLCFLQGALNIFRFTGRRQANQHISRKAKCRHLASENFVEAIIVARGSEKSAVAG